MKLPDLGIQIRKIRKDKNLTQEQLCKIANISRPTLSKLENGYFGMISVVKLDAILAALGYEICIESFNPFWNNQSLLKN
ncbi:MAG: helix-turn-helix domain-containing protein [Candidatus Muirbacterium halophilum]|nr:helix-turn-helix domain-containing protein [Candidatus Muirbacterium halophilum]MCK9474983.1 helix-turn-helix domain-containing protein [Candidatus Muirbacterium halophilum]